MTKQFWRLPTCFYCWNMEMSFEWNLIHSCVSVQVCCLSLLSFPYFHQWRKRNFFQNGECNGAIDFRLEIDFVRLLCYRLDASIIQFYWIGAAKFVVSACHHFRRTLTRLYIETTWFSLGLNSLNVFRARHYTIWKGPNSSAETATPEQLSSTIYIISGSIHCLSMQ